jgi:hypothetical protein
MLNYVQVDVIVWITLMKMLRRVKNRAEKVSMNIKMN